MKKPASYSRCISCGHKCQSNCKCDGGSYGKPFSRAVISLSPLTFSNPAGHTNVRSRAAAAGLEEEEEATLAGNTRPAVCVP